MSNGLQSSITEYLSGFQYRKSAKGRRISPSVPRLVFFPTAEGYFNVVSASPLGELVGAYVYNYTDHLGNIRLSYTFDEQNNMLKIMEENHYYPFGLKHQNYNSEMLDYTLEDNEVALQTFANQIGDGKYNYKYNGKEYQEELGLNWSDFGFRNYDAALGRWVNVDLLAEKNYNYSTYNYVKNSPLYRFDPNGLTDYTLDRKTGEVKQVGEKNDKPDRILKTNSKGEVKYNKKTGEAKVAIDKIETGILKDGQNFKEGSTLINIGEKGQPTREGVEKFALQLSGYVGKEIGGTYFSKDGAEKITHIGIGGYKDNYYTENKNNGSNAPRTVSSTIEELQSYQIRGFLHTHPNEPSRFNSSEADRNFKNNALKQIPNLFFFIITHPEPGGTYPERINFTNH